MFEIARKNKINSSILRNSMLVGGWINPFEKYARQIGWFLQIGVNIKNIWNHNLAKDFQPIFWGRQQGSARKEKLRHV